MNNFITFITVITFTLGIIAPACGFAWNKNDYSVIEICTVNGIENRIVSNDEAPNNAPNNVPAEHQTSEQCQFCFAQNNLEAHKAPSSLVLNSEFVAQKIKAVQFETTFLSKTRSPQSTRAPPALL